MTKKVVAPASGMRPWWLLKHVDFLSVLPPDDLGTVASSLVVTRVKKGETIFDSVASLEQVHILVTGAVKVARVDPDSGKELILHIVAPGEPFGVIPFIIEERSESIAIAHRASRVATIDRTTLEPLLDNRGVDKMFLQLVAARGRRLEERLVQFAFHDVAQRLALLLLQLAEQFPNDRACGRAISIWFSQQDLGNFIGATREAASLTLNEFKREGWIAIHGRKICLHDVEALRTASA